MTTNYGPSDDYGHVISLMTGLSLYELVYLIVIFEIFTLKIFETPCIGPVASLHRAFYGEVIVTMLRCNIDKFVDRGVPDSGSANHSLVSGIHSN